MWLVFVIVGEGCDSYCGVLCFVLREFCYCGGCDCYCLGVMFVVCGLCLLWWEFCLLLWGLCLLLSFLFGCSNLIM